tara:strand:- start:65 stop:970 length:906 start_codon:yes stop_codon:yes gene_type:complete
MSQITKNILMIRPLSFGFNNDTSNDNYFQKNVDHLTKSKIKSNALKEFENMCSILRKNSINVVVLENDNKNLTDDVFPNNWISFHGDKYIIHSMFAKSRRAEKNTSFINMLALKNFDYELLNDYSKYEGNNMHLEGTGSVVLDRINKVAYCSISKRSNLKLFNIFCNDIGYDPIPFKSYDSRGDLIYHTNVMMCVGDDFALICYESIKDAKERKQVKTFLEKSGKTIITISLKQVDSFAGNIIQLGDNEHKIIVISKVAYNSLNEDQKNKLSKESKIISIPIPTIQTCGGGSVRCMIAELI